MSRSVTITVEVEPKGTTKGIKLKCIRENGETQDKQIQQNGIATFTFDNVEERAIIRCHFTLDPSHTEWEIDKTGGGTSTPSFPASEADRPISLTLKKINYIKSFKIQELQPPYIHTVQRNPQSPQENSQIILEAEINQQGETVKWGYYLKEINEDLKESIPISTEGIPSENPQQTGTIQTAQVNLAEILLAHKDKIINLSNPNQRGTNQNQTQSNSNDSSQTSNQSQPIDFHIVFFAYLKNPAYNNDQHIQTHLILRVSEIPLLSFYKEGGKVKLRVDYQQKREEVEIGRNLPSTSFNNIKAKIQKDENNYKLTIENQDSYSHNTQEFKIPIPNEGLELLKNYFETNQRG